MDMSFSWTSEIDHFLFYGYTITTVGGLIATCLGVAALALLFEWCKLLQAQHRQRQLVFRAKQLRNICPTENANLLDGTRRRKPDDFKITTKNRIGLPCFDAFLWIFSYDIGYLLMLTVMAYNGWIFISVVVGSGLGYFIFGQSFMKINLQNCQLIRSTFCSSNCGDPDFCGGPRDGESTPALEASSSNALPNCHSQTSITVHSTSSDEND